MNALKFLMLTCLVGCGSNFGTEDNAPCTPQFQAAYSQVYDSFHAAESIVTSTKFTETQKLPHWQSVKASCDSFYAQHTDKKCRWSSSKPEVSGNDFKKICEIATTKATAAPVAFYE